MPRDGFRLLTGNGCIKKVVGQSLRWSTFFQGKKLSTEGASVPVCVTPGPVGLSTNRRACGQGSYAYGRSGGALCAGLFGCLVVHFFRNGRPRLFGSPFLQKWASPAVCGCDKCQRLGEKLQPKSQLAGFMGAISHRGLRPIFGVSAMKAKLLRLAALSVPLAGAASSYAVDPATALEALGTLSGTTAGYGPVMFGLAIAAVGIGIGVKWIKRGKGAA
jgi:hypothetical protein